MTAYMRTGDGLKMVEVLKQPFKVNGIRLFVYRDEFSKYAITEWESGLRFTSTKNKAKIRQAINNVFEKIPIEQIKRIIQKNIEKYGTANDPHN